MAVQSPMNKLISEHIDIWTSAVKTKSASGRGSSKKLELYGVKKLRELILELAVRGKLVPQDPNDEPASVLLERIAQEKAQLVKEKKTTKPKKLAEVCDDEFSFELPSNWDIRRLPDVYYTISPSGKKLKSSDVLEHGSYPVIDQGQEAIAGYSNDEERVIDIESPIIIFGDHTRNIKYVDFSFVPGADGTKILCPIGIAPEFFYLQLRSYDIESRGYGRHFKILNENLFVIPSLEEQQRIVAKVDELMTLCDQLEQQTEASIEAHQVLVTTLLDTLTNSSDADELMQNWARISEHFDTLFTTEESIDQLKQTILQLAVMGKLVPQDPSDEPAAELLKRIAEEKTQLVKEKKIKKQKALPPISEDEKPFELPNGWEWCRLGELVNIRGGKRLPKGHALTQEPTPYVYIRVSDMKNGTVSTADLHYLSKEAQEQIKNYIITSDDIYMTIVGATIGKCGVVPVELCGMNLTENAARLSPYSDLDKHYLHQLLSSGFAQTQFVDKTKQVGVQKMALNRLASTLVPLPPINQQRLIFSKLSELFDICHKLQLQITTSQDIQLHFTDAIVEQVM